ncbi:transporter substrate-binding domain-containing diguanylate cyclase [Vibrio sp. SCSIO 43137]|uniref:transporter substrate-binding domain-containing diguanylate cyclase n=1 Tax=Vibrio sp. SCSIO 43137 TaxID=3021011 RepID=UPI00230715A5|nr:transporter substrate-binding domain-containing protein [Vibrio sp. SCSIO 43137]WCE31387.1 transporter substrate-binding domain-containing protein [Vibrio sp. SCSIO 43137]
MIKGTDGFFTGLLRYLVFAVTFCFVVSLQAVAHNDGGHLSPELQQKLSQEEINYLKDKQVLRVANVVSFEPFSFSREGKAQGYSMEYMTALGARLGVQVEHVTGDWQHLLSKLMVNELDVIPHMAKTAEREKYIKYSAKAHFRYTTGYVIRKNEKVDRFRDLGGKTIAVINRSFLQDHLQRLHPDMKLLPVMNAKEGIFAVSEGKADAAIGSLPAFSYHIEENWLTNLNARKINDAHLSDGTELYMGVTKDNTLLMSILDKVTESFPREEMNKLKLRWLSGISDEKNTNSLNKKEKEFIQAHNRIRFRVRPNRPPFEFDNDGEPAGLAVDYVKAAAKNIGLQPEFVLSDMSLSDSFDMVLNQRSEFDALPFLPQSPKFKSMFSYGDAYLTFPMMVISNKDAFHITKLADLAGRSVVIEEGFLTNDWLKRDYPEINRVSASSTLAALEMVNSEQVDAYVGNLAVANYMMSYGGMDNLKLAVPSGYGDITYYFVAPKQWPELASALSKGYRSISPKEHSAIQQKWFSVQVVKSVDYNLVWQLTLGASLLMVIFGSWNYTLRKQKNKTELALAELKEAQYVLQELSVTDRLTTLYNRLKLDEVLQDEFERARRYHSSFGVIMLDIDYFKHVNDKLGHIAGDNLLVNFSALLKEKLRANDVVGRWGGEEFLIICPQTDCQGMLSVAEKLRAEIESFNFPETGKITASFGVAEFHNKEKSIRELLTKADAALYKSKSEGRNRVSCDCGKH